MMTVNVGTLPLPRVSGPFRRTLPRTLRLISMFPMSVTEDRIVALGIMISILQQGDLHSPAHAAREPNLTI